MQQGVLLGRHQEEMAASRRAYSEISLQLNQLVERLISCTPSLQWQPLLPFTMEQVTVMRNHGSILLPLTRVSPTHVALFCPNALWPSHCSCPVFPRGALRLLSSSRSWWGKWENGGRPCGITNRIAVPPLTVSRRYARCLIDQFRELRRHEPWHCYDKERVQFPAIRSSFARSRHPVAGTTRLCGITSFTVWPSTSRMRSIPWNYPRAWMDSSISSSEWTTRFLFILVIRGAGFPLSLSLEPCQERRVTRLPNISCFPRRSRCRSGERGWLPESGVIA